MRLKLLYSVLILAAAVIVISCNGVDHLTNSNASKPAGLVDPKGGTGPETVYADGARRITIDEFDELMKKGEVFIVDVRNQAAYDLGHIPGSRLIPAGEIANHLNELPRDKMIVTYCS